MSDVTGSVFRAGAAKVDISPEDGVQIAGDIGRKRPCTGVEEPIYARALVLERGGKRYCILSLDVLAIDNPWVDEIRRRARKDYGLAPEAVMVHITQNHAAPSIGDHFCRKECELFPAEHPWLRGGDDRYNEPAVSGTLDAIGKALARLTPVTVSAGRTMDGRFAFNRRYVMRDGSAICHPPQCSPDILHVEGPTDPEVGVITFTGEDGRVVSALLHHTCHPTHGFSGNVVIGDWPGTWCSEMEAYFGDGCTPLVINGCCGNICPYNHIDPAPVHDHRRMGMLLAESAKRALGNMKAVDTSEFAWTRRVVEIPRRKMPDKLLAEAKKILEEHPEPLWKDDIRVEWDWVYAVSIIDLAEVYKLEPIYPYEIQAVRIGDAALLALMGEPFVEAQLRIKQLSPFSFTQVAHMCNGYVGYLPTRRAFAGGGYETRTGCGSRLAPEALETVEGASIELLGKLHGE